MRVEENIAYPLKLRRWPPEDRARRVEEMLALVELEGTPASATRASFPVGNSSVGGCLPSRRPASSAARWTSRSAHSTGPCAIGMQEEIRRIHRESAATILYVTHDQKEALTMSDRVAILRDGRLLQVGPPRELYRRPVDRFVATFFGECTLVPATLLGQADADHVRVATLGREAIVRRGGPSLDEDLLAGHPAGKAPAPSGA